MIITFEDSQTLCLIVYNCQNDYQFFYPRRIIKIDLRQVAFFESDANYVNIYYIRGGKKQKRY